MHWNVAFTPLQLSRAPKVAHIRCQLTWAKSARAGALHDTGATDHRPRANAKRLGLRRPSAALARASRSRDNKTLGSREKRQRAGALQDAGATDHRPRANAKRLGLRRPSAALACASRSRDNNTLRPREKRQRAGALQDAGATESDPREREASWTAAALRRSCPRKPLTRQ